jgi:SAM-dependent methyltransferase
MGFSIDDPEKFYVFWRAEDVMPTQNEALCAYYAARAKDYDKVYEKPERQADLRFLEKWIPGLLRARRVLEIACGTGYWTQFYAPLAEGVIALDAAEEMLALARTRAGVSGVLFRQADAYNLPQDLGFCNIAFAAFWFSHVPVGQRQAFLAQLNARLAPEARVVLIDNRYVEGSSTPICESDGEGNTYQMREGPLGPVKIVKNFPTQQELEKMVEGFAQNTNYRAFDYYWAFAYQIKGRI